MEEQEIYDRNDFGKIPRNTRIEFAYAIVGVAMGVLGEANAAVGRVLNGEKVEESATRTYFDVAGSLIRNAQNLIEAETWRVSPSRVPF